MYGAWALPMIWPYSWFSSTISQTERGAIEPTEGSAVGDADAIASGG